MRGNIRLGMTVKNNTRCVRQNIFCDSKHDPTLNQHQNNELTMLKGLIIIIMREYILTEIQAGVIDVGSSCVNQDGHSTDLDK